jgi:hypothetical protein
MSVPLDLMAAGTSAAIELKGLAAGADDVLLLLLLLQPTAASALTASTTAPAARGFRVLRGLTGYPALLSSWI